jgi:site-specific recombinase XerD
MSVPAMIAAAGERASLGFIDFFTANVRNPNTSAAYGVSVRGFFTWLETRGLAALGTIRTHHVSTYIEMLTSRSAWASKTPEVHKLCSWMRLWQSG